MRLLDTRTMPIVLVFYKLAPFTFLLRHGPLVAKDL